MTAIAPVRPQMTTCARCGKRRPVVGMVRGKLGRYCPDIDGCGRRAKRRAAA